MAARIALQLIQEFMDFIPDPDICHAMTQMVSLANQLKNDNRVIALDIRIYQRILGWMKQITQEATNIPRMELLAIQKLMETIIWLEGEQNKAHHSFLQTVRECHQDRLDLAIAEYLWRSKTLYEKLLESPMSYQCRIMTTANCEQYHGLALYHDARAEQMKKK